MGYTGTSLHKNNPYWLNQKHIGYITDAMETLVKDGEDFPERRLTPTQKQTVSLNNWLNSLKEKYL